MKKAKRILFILVGTFIMSLGLYFFLFAADIAGGGVGGLALAINYLFPKLEIGFLVTLLNIILFVVGLVFFGKEFSLNTLLGAVSYSLFIMVFDIFFKGHPALVDDPIINLLVGSTLMGAGLAMVFNVNASTGGTDILAKIMETFAGIKISTAVMFTDGFIILFIGLIMGLDIAIYSVVSIAISSMALDKFISGFNTKISMTIISTEYEKINDFILKDLNRGTTIYKAMGGYTKHDRNVLMVVVDRQQYIKIKKYIGQVDPMAFVFTKQVTEVIGEGFTREIAND